jgi:hypothetical protein
MAGQRRLIVQFLEGGSSAAGMPPEQAADTLRMALAHLPITDLCVGWRLPPDLLEGVATTLRTAPRERTVALWLWHPLLSGDGIEPIRDEDLALGPSGAPIRDLAADAFTFLCANRTGAFARAIDRLMSDIGGGPFDGVFLDRIRWPSPAAAPDRLLACFCDACTAAAETDGLDLRQVATEIGRLAETLDGRRALVRVLLGAGGPRFIDRFLRWRVSVILQAVERASDTARTRIGLDVFSPGLARMVGQDIRRLARRAEWTKAMTYSTVHAPAGMPYELAALLRWLEAAGDDGAGAFLAGILGYDLPPELGRGAGALGPDAVRLELGRLRRSSGARGVAGIESVAMKGVVEMTLPMLLERLALATELQVPVALSWDLAQMPMPWVRAVGRYLREE